MTPAAPASADPMKNVDAITRSTSIPIIDAASRSNDVARIALPIFVRATNSVRATIKSRAATISQDLRHREEDVAEVIRLPPISSKVP